MVIGLNNVVITIARQYGSGGRTIGEMLAKKLNVHYYDKELMKLASDDSGINEALFVNADEKVKNTSLFHNSFKGTLRFLAKLGGKKVMFIELDDVARLIEGNSAIDV